MYSKVARFILTCVYSSHPYTMHFKLDWYPIKGCQGFHLFCLTYRCTIGKTASYLSNCLQC